MADLGLTYVRIGEFAWSRLEPNPGEYQFDWLDAAIESLTNAGLKLVMGTPTATPPKWLIDQHPEILPVDPDTGRTRGFGSRRHYDFSSAVYLRESMRITEALAKRYGNHDGDSTEQLCFHLTHCNTRIGVGLFFKVPDLERDDLVRLASQPFWIRLFFNHAVILLANDWLPIASMMGCHKNL